MAIYSLPARHARITFWRNQLKQADHTRARIGKHESAVTLRIVSACSTRSVPIAGDTWLVVGDAAAAFDPLSSQGVAWALESGLMAATVIDSRLRGDQRALAGYASEVKAEFVRYLELRANYYDRERPLAKLSFLAAPAYDTADRTLIPPQCDLKTNPKNNERQLPLVRIFINRLKASPDRAGSYRNCRRELRLPIRNDRNCRREPPDPQ